MTTGEHDGRKLCFAFIEKLHLNTTHVVLQGLSQLQNPTAQGPQEGSETIFWPFLGPRGPLAEPSMSTRPPVHPSRPVRNNFS